MMLGKKTNFEFWRLIWKLHFTFNWLDSAAPEPLARTPENPCPSPSSHCCPLPSYFLLGPAVLECIRSHQLCGLSSLLSPTVFEMKTSPCVACQDLNDPPPIFLSRMVSSFSIWTYSQAPEFCQKDPAGPLSPRLDVWGRDCSHLW